MAVLHGAFVTLACIVTEGNITATVLWFIVSTGVTGGLSFCKEGK
ncbi:MAG: hypothetical protein U9O89_00780 [Thermoproteota archaeon]|nr:hypothetical protein [Thermoproteota archaeon]